MRISDWSSDVCSSDLQKPSLSAEKQRRFQIGNQRMAVRNTAQDFSDGRQHQKKSAQAQADGFDVSGDARRTQNASNPITCEQEQDCHDPDGMTDRLMCNEEYRCGTDKHGNEIDGAQRRAGKDSAMPGEHVEG